MSMLKEYLRVSIRFISIIIEVKFLFNSELSQGLDYFHIQALSACQIHETSTSSSLEVEISGILLAAYIPICLTNYPAI